ncbi:MAG: DEAD/DEAH box helicase [Thermomicrobiales bacterium]|nr:DEAD/DEAH box helicase [Thermomicrobiales bacterium]
MSDHADQQTESNSTDAVTAAVESASSEAIPDEAPAEPEAQPGLTVPESTPVPPDAIAVHPIKPEPVEATERRSAVASTSRPARSDKGRGELAAAVESTPAAIPEEEEHEPTFEDLGISGPLLKPLKDLGYEEPTPIQVRTIPLLLEGRDVIAQAQTGSGKTAAFGLPIIESINPKERFLQALILCPTRELAIQVSEALHKYGRYKDVETMPVYGGQPYERQFRGLQRGVQIVVGTPGRVMDHMRRGTLSLDHLRFFILDEADEMLDMGFVDDIEWILEQAPENRQTALFSATMPPRIADLARKYMHEPVRVTVAGKEMTVPQVRQSSFEVPRSRKVDALTRILDAETPTSAMIFGRTKVGVDELGEALMARGYAVETLHGDLSQAQRDRVMRRFRGGQADILIATDVAARGLDIPDVSHVINYDLPDSAEAYVHRIGRTGRAGRAGEAISLITPREVRWLRQIERTTRARIEPRRLPTLADVAERRREAIKQQVEAVLVQDDGYTQYLDTVEDLAEDHEISEVAAAILKLYADESGRTMTPEQQEDDIAIFSAATGGSRGPRSETGMVRLFLNVGRGQSVRPQDIVGAIANEAGIPGRAIGAIDILDAYSFVDIPQEFVDRVLAAMRHVRIKGRFVNAEVARPGGPDAGRGGWDRGPRPGGPHGNAPRGGWQRGPQDGDARPRREAAPRRNPNVGGVRVGPRDEGGARRFERNEPAGPRRFERRDEGKFRPRHED